MIFNRNNDALFNFIYLKKLDQRYLLIKDMQEGHWFSGIEDMWYFNSSQKKLGATKYNNAYLLNISFKLLAGKNLTFWEAEIWIDSPVLGFLPTLAFLFATL